ncbi:MULTISPECIES: phage tail assembly protein [Pseudomonas]|uniref:Phage tail assembly protein n=1 Tax=Pseudomonas lactis TaxID=1615674 RepID=A0A7Y1Q981_9PSED|nr:MULTISPECIES: phage tail assembly protein [Pseudomonas]KRP83801.1 tail fiber protein [Pseudomonas lactis]NNA71658.1 phage tail assembly protein [Pseudomonas lactis]NNA78258.1 phage tail assembly protein [Pseudomonas lactis]OKO48296.1 phage tail protein [Pseudomonas sp. BTN1]PMU25086.1 phage tail assembly protein [Pseudomonas sp. GP01-A9]
MDTAATAQTDVKPLVDDNTVILDTPIRRGTTTIDSISLRKPNSGELRGVSLAELLNMDVASLLKVLPRISTPTLTAVELAGMDPADLFILGNKVSGFLLQKQLKTDASLVA